MSKVHTVAEGECLSSIAYGYGFFYETIWDHPENAALKELRKDPTVLKAGDRVFIPDKRQKTVSRKTGASYKFRRKGVPAQLKTRLVLAGKPRSDLDYVLEVDGRRYTGKTDGDGVLQQAVSPDATSATLILQGGDGEEVYELRLGAVDPVDDVSGMQARLRSLGFYTGEIDGEEGEPTREAVRIFQRHHGLDATGEADEATRGKLLQESGG